MNDNKDLLKKKAAYQLKWRTEKQSAAAKLKDAWMFQRNAARVRGIEFLLTFDEWLKIWMDSGHLHERGRRRHQYCMSRRGDAGAYVVGNVDIKTVAENVREQVNPWLGRRLTPEHKAKLALSKMGNKHGSKRLMKLQRRSDFYDSQMYGCAA